MADHIKGLYEKYLAESSCIMPQAGLSFDEFCELANKMLAGAEHICIEDKSVGSGVLYYSLWQENGYQVCDVPVYGYCASSEKALSMLFCLLSDKLLKNGTTLFQIHLYAHDTQAQRSFSMMQFGYMSEKGVLNINDAEYISNDLWTVRTLSKEDIRENWRKIWDMTYGIVRHLQSAPVFYPGDEFTEEVYKEFYLDGETSVHAAFTPDDQMIGMIETNRESTWFIGEKLSSANVGEAYVVPSYRGSGAAQALLRYAAEYEKQRGAEYLWVEHGTANPNARGFWNKYFKTYQYELVRKIESLF